MEYSAGEVALVREGIGAGIRLDGRATHQYRPITITPLPYHHSACSFILIRGGSKLLFSSRANIGTGKVIRVQVRDQDGGKMGVGVDLEQIGQVLAHMYPAVHTTPAPIFHFDVLITHNDGGVCDLISKGVLYGLEQMEVPVLSGEEWEVGTWMAATEVISPDTLPLIAHIAIIDHIPVLDPSRMESALADHFIGFGVDGGGCVQSVYFEVGPTPLSPSVIQALEDWIPPLLPARRAETSTQLPQMT